LNDKKLAEILAKVIFYTSEAVEDAEKAVKSYHDSDEGLADVNLVLNSFGNRIGISHRILQHISQLKNLPDEIESLVNQLENMR